jgi:hypothetical protein
MVGRSHLIMGISQINKITQRRLDAIINFLSENQPASSAEIVYGTIMPNGKLLRNHKYLGLNAVQMSSMLMRMPDYFRKDESHRVIMWRLKGDGSDE